MLGTVGSVRRYSCIEFQWLRYYLKFLGITPKGCKACFSLMLAGDGSAKVRTSRVTRFNAYTLAEEVESVKPNVRMNHESTASGMFTFTSAVSVGLCKWIAMWMWYTFTYLRKWRPQR